MKIPLKPVRYIAWLALIVMVAVSIAGCSKNTATAAENVRSASRQTANADSVSFEMKVAMSGVAGMDVDMDAEGVYDLKNERMQMTLDIIGMQTEAVLDGQVMYMKMPLLGEDWFKLNVAELLGDQAAASSGFQDPTQILEWLTASGDDVTKVGSDRIRGQDADHYRVILKIEDLLENLDGEVADHAREALEGLGQDALEIHAWVNEDGLPVKVEYEMSFANSDVPELQEMTAKYTLEYFDWGKPVRVDVPDPASVKQFSEIMGNFDLD